MHDTSAMYNAFGGEERSNVAAARDVCGLDL